MKLSGVVFSFYRGAFYCPRKIILTGTEDYWKVELRDILRKTGWRICYVDPSKAPQFDQLFQHDLVDASKVVYWVTVKETSVLEGITFLKVLVNRSRKVVFDCGDLAYNYAEIPKWKIIESSDVGGRSYNKWIKYELSRASIAYRRDLADMLQNYFGYHLHTIRMELQKLASLGKKFVTLNDLRRYCISDSSGNWWFRDWMNGNREALKRYIMTLSGSDIKRFIVSAAAFMSKYAKYGYYKDVIKAEDYEIEGKLNVSKWVYELFSSKSYKGDTQVGKFIQWLCRGDYYLNEGVSMNIWLREMI